MAKVFICRCEDVLVSEIQDAIEAGHTTIESLKRYTGLGTGVCQGKCCVAETARLLSESGKVDAKAITPFTPRPPLSPIPLRLLATVDADGDET